MIKVLDHGFVNLISYMGQDISSTDLLDTIVGAARVSTKSQKTDEQANRKLLKYLFENKHTSPFEMCEIKLHCKMPIFVARQWVRHRTASLNEVSGRYTQLPDEFYVPLKWRTNQGVNNRQSSREFESNASSVYLHACKQAFDQYHSLLECGVAREMARMVLPLSTYTEWVWKIDLHNLMHFLRLRLHKHAQWELRQYAKAIFMIAMEIWPNAIELLLLELQADADYDATLR